MASQVVMPKMSETMEEGIIVKWLKREGERVEAGEALAEVETDKAVLELEAYTSGVLRKILVQEDAKVPVGNLVAVIAAEDEDISSLIGAAAALPSTLEQTLTAHRPGPAVGAPGGMAAPEVADLGPRQVIVHERVDTSPLARRMAEEAGIDIAQIRGTGPGGRVVKRDVEALIAEQKIQVSQRSTPSISQGTPPATLPPRGEEIPGRAEAGEVEYEDHELSLMRKTIVRRLVQSKSMAPHFYVTTEVAMDEAVALRTSLNNLASEDRKISVNDMILKAVALALRRFPRMNVSYEADRIRMHRRVHIGMAVALEDGLITPVIRDCDRKSLGEIAREAKELSERARARRLKPEEYTGGTFSVSNLGMFDVEDFSAIINPPEAAILAVGAIKERPVVVNGQLAVGHRMKVTLSCDHRVVDGATAAQFLQILKPLIERPLNLML